MGFVALSLLLVKLTAADPAERPFGVSANGIALDLTSVPTNLPTSPAPTTQPASQSSSWVPVVATGVGGLIGLCGGFLTAIYNSMTTARRSESERNWRVKQESYARALDSLLSTYRSLTHMSMPNSDIEAMSRDDRGHEGLAGAFLVADEDSAHRLLECIDWLASKAPSVIATHLRSRGLAKKAEDETTRLNELHSKIESLDQARKTAPTASAELHSIENDLAIARDSLKGLRSDVFQTALTSVSNFSDTLLASAKLRDEFLEKSARFVLAARHDLKLPVDARRVTLILNEANLAHITMSRDISRLIFDELLAACTPESTNANRGSGESHESSPQSLQIDGSQTDQ